MDLKMGTSRELVILVYILLPFLDQNGKAVICVEGRFFLLELSEEKVEGLRMWE